MVSNAKAILNIHKHDDIVDVISGSINLKISTTAADQDKDTQFANELKYKMRELEYQLNKKE